MTPLGSHWWNGQTNFTWWFVTVSIRWYHQDFVWNVRRPPPWRQHPGRQPPSTAWPGWTAHSQNHPLLAARCQPRGKQLHLIEFEMKKIWTGAHESHTSTPVVPSLRVTLVRDIACNIHCIDSGTYKKRFFLRILHGTALADHKLGVSHQNRKFCQQPEKVENLIPAISFSIIVPIACFLLKVDRSSLTVWKPPSSSLSGVTNRVNKSPSLIESCP